jgi:hypothetical protein
MPIVQLGSFGNRRRIAVEGGASIDLATHPRNPREYVFSCIGCQTFDFRLHSRLRGGAVARRHHSGGRHRARDRLSWQCPKFSGMLCSRRLPRAGYHAAKGVGVDGAGCAEFLITLALHRQRARDDTANHQRPTTIEKRRLLRAFPCFTSTGHSGFDGDCGAGGSSCVFALEPRRPRALPMPRTCGSATLRVFREKTCEGEYLVTFLARQAPVRAGRGLLRSLADVAGERQRSTAANSTWTSPDRSAPAPRRLSPSSHAMKRTLPPPVSAANPLVGMFLLSWGRNFPLWSLS